MFTAQQAPNIAFAGNYVVPNGVLSTDVTAGRRPDIFPAGVFTALTVLGTIAAVFLVLATVPAVVEAASRFRERDYGVRDPVRALVSLTLLGYIAGYGVAALFRLPIYDRYLLPLVFLVAAALPFALGSALSRGLFAAAVAFAAGWHALAALSWPNFPLDLSFPAANGSVWFLAHGWVAPSAGGSLGLAPAFSIAVGAVAAALALFAAVSAARPLAPGAPAAVLIGLVPLGVLLLRPPALSYPARLLRAAIYGDYSGRDPNHDELRRVAERASTPAEHRQGERALETVIRQRLRVR